MLGERGNRNRTCTPIDINYSISNRRNHILQHTCFLYFHTPSSLQSEIHKKSRVEYCKNLLFTALPSLNTQHISAINCHDKQLALTVAIICMCNSINHHRYCFHNFAVCIVYVCIYILQYTVTRK